MKKLLLSAILLSSVMVQAQITSPLEHEKTSEIIGNKPQVNIPNSVNKAASIWGAGAAVGAADGEFQNAFTQAGTYSAGDNPTTWTALSVYDANGTPGAAYWTRSATGAPQGAYWNNPVGITSPSVANGSALFDSDFMDNNGVAGAFGTGSSPSPHKGELISPRIDLTGYTNIPLAINFYSFYRNFAITELSASISTDDGATWSAPVDYTGVQASLTNGWVNVVFPSATNGVANLTQCRIKFTFDGDYYFAIVDDVSLVEAIAIDLTILEENPAGSTLAEAYEQVQVTNNRFYPVGQLNANNFKFGANIKNLGIQDLIAADSAKLHVEIQQDLSGTWTPVYNQNLTVDTVLTSVGSAFSGDLTDNSWAVVGDYRTRYVISCPSDNNSLNDTVYHYFSITPNDYASKVDLDLNGNPNRTRPIFPGGTSFSDFEYGSMFEFSNATNDNLKVDSVSYTYYLPNGYTGSTDYTFFVNIYQFVDGSNGGTLDGTLDASGNELTYLGIGVSTLSGLGTTVPAGTYASATVTNLIDPSIGIPMSSLTDGYYLVTLKNNPSLTGGGTFTSTTSPWFGASEQKNYAMNATLTSANPSPVIVRDPAGTGDWNWVGFGADMVPSIGVHLSASCVATASTDTQVACGSYTWPLNSTTYTSSTNTETVILTNAAGCDSIVTLDLTIKQATTGLQNLVECAGYSITVGANTYNTTGVYTDTLVAAAANGCDSILTTDLTVLPELTGLVNNTICNNESVVINGTTYNAGNPTGTEVFTNVGPNNCDSTVTVALNVETAIDVTIDNTLMPTLTANQIGASYQWLDCDNGNAIIPTETNQSFTATVNGNYAVEITVGSCVDTSACENITGVGIKEAATNVVSIYPNPTNGLFTISLANTNQPVSYTVTTLEGRLVEQVNNVTTNNIEVDLTKESKGVYFLLIQENNTNTTYKIVKQ
jgi:Secretion system C-terminal sorting domain